jgi:abhydrolase domain-containing protein 11
LQLAVTKYAPDGSISNTTASESVTCEGEHGPFVFVHGLFGSRNNFRTLSKEFAIATGRDVLSVDLRNHGESPWDAIMTYPALAADLGACLRQHVQTATPATVIGHSMGGKTVMTLALQQPELVNKLVVVDIAPVTYPTMRQARAVARAMASVPLTGPNAIHTRQDADTYLRQDVKEDVIRRFALTNFIQGPKPTDPARWKVNLDVVLDNMPALATFPKELEGSFYDRSTLFYYGLKSDYVVDTSHDVIRRYFPCSRLLGAPTGHWVHAERPKQFLKAVVAFDAEA